MDARYPGCSFKSWSQLLKHSAFACVPLIFFSLCSFTKSNNEQQTWSWSSFGQTEPQNTSWVTLFFKSVSYFFEKQGMKRIAEQRKIRQTIEDIIYVETEEPTQTQQEEKEHCVP